MIRSIGFIQGRLSDRVDGKVQAFPWRDWETEFPVASAFDFHLVEWTLDQDRLYENPLMTAHGQARIRELCSKYDIKIPSLTGDCFMQAPFWKTSGYEREALLCDFIAIAIACEQVGIGLIVVPLVDNGRLENARQEDILITFMLSNKDFFQMHGLRIIFESDFDPAELARFIGRLPQDTFGINYDIGNSAALGYSPEEEFAAYGSRILNVHLKDRHLGGGTVPLGTGNADFPTVLRLLRDVNYEGYLIMQTARARDNNHAGALRVYREQIKAWAKGA